MTRNNQFCFPIAVNLNHKNYLLPLIVVQHFATAVLIVGYFPLWPAGLSLTIILISLRFNVSAQQAVDEYVLLSASLNGTWSVSRSNGEKSNIHIDCIFIFGSLMLIRWVRFGGSCYWLTWASQQTDNHWHRMMVFNRFYLS